MGVTQMSTTSPRRSGPRRFPLEPGSRLRAGLAREHRRQPFRPGDVRDAARRALAVAESLGLSGHLARGGLDVGGAELDHVWAVVSDRVVDVTLPVLAQDFLVLLRGYVAGDVPAAVLDDVATAYTLEWRVVGDVPTGCRYLGAPILCHRSRALVPR
jgi:hypothetical protein